MLMLPKLVSDSAAGFEVAVHGRTNGMRSKARLPAGTAVVSAAAKVLPVPAKMKAVLEQLHDKSEKED